MTDTASKRSTTGWILSYCMFLVLTPFGTCTQGDDDPWAASILYSVVPLTGLLLLFTAPDRFRQATRLGLPHFLTLLLIIRNTPSYWINCTFKGKHIAAGFSNGYEYSFNPEWWHRFWAPYVTLIGLIFITTGAIFFINFMRKRRKSSTALNRTDLSV